MRLRLQVFSSAPLAGLPDGVAVLIWFLQALVLPGHRAISTPGLAVSFAEFGLGLWLLVRGVRAAPGTRRSVASSADTWPPPAGVRG